jgi:hypothetical protein
VRLSELERSFQSVIIGLKQPFEADFLCPLFQELYAVGDTLLGQ